MSAGVHRQTGQQHSTARQRHTPPGLTATHQQSHTLSTHTQCLHNRHARQKAPTRQPGLEHNQGVGVGPGPAGSAATYPVLSTHPSYSLNPDRLDHPPVILMATLPTLPIVCPPAGPALLLLLVPCPLLPANSCSSTTTGGASSTSHAPYLLITAWGPAGGQREHRRGATHSRSWAVECWGVSRLSHSSHPILSATNFAPFFAQRPSVAA